MRNVHPYTYRKEQNRWSPKAYEDWTFVSSSGFNVGDLRAEAAEALKYASPDRRRVAIDVGARHGCYTRVLQVSGFRHIHAFEMVELHLPGFLQNINMANVTLYNFPLYSHETQMTVNGKFILEVDDGGEYQNSSWYASNHLDELRNSNDAEIVTAYAIDQFNFEYVDFIKIDCDGPDRLVLNGALKTIERWRPIIHLETHRLQVERDPDPTITTPSDLYESFVETYAYTPIVQFDESMMDNHGKDTVLVPTERIQP